MKYRIEYIKKGIPGYLYKYANSARELLVVLTDLNTEWIDFETIIAVSYTHLTLPTNREV